MGEILRIAGKPDEAIPWYRQAAAADPQYLEPELYLAASLYAQEKFAEAREAIARAMAINPNDYRAFTRLGLIQIRQNQMMEARDTALRAVALAPDSGAAYNNLGRVYYALRDMEASRAAYQRAIALEPANAACRVGFGMALARSGMLQEAKQEFATAMSLDPTYRQAYDRLAEVQDRLKETQLAAVTRARAKEYGL
jgi:tetratricopeptide (TPR) repeat protein